jgi:outer membrane protein
MRKHLLAFVCAVSALVLVCVVTGQAQDLKVAFVDLQKFASKSVKAQTMQKKLMDLMNTKRTALENKKKELADLQDQLQKQGPMLKEDTRNQKIKEIGIKEMEFKLAEKEAQNSLQNEERDTMESFQRDLTKIIARIRAQKGLIMVFNQAALLSADDALDITDDVAKAYDAETGAPAAAPAPKPKAPAAAPGGAPVAPAKKAAPPK